MHSLLEQSPGESSKELPKWVLAEGPSPQHGLTRPDKNPDRGQASEYPPGLTRVSNHVEASVPATASASAADKPSRTIRRRALKQRAAQAKRAAAEKPKPKPKPRRAESSRSGSLPVLHEDQHVIAVDKPAGMLSHASEGDSSASLVDALAGRQVVAGHSPLSEEMLMPRLAPTGEPDSHIPRCVVHRLDRGTSGALLLAKTPQAEAALGAAFRSRTTAK
uniref:Pseudouridine synthase RsuA/RluA-like domain-containing protein n=2 Tax=Emiliania huxleyi TaxID=2903 RepID=A0A0D3J9N6_EMIH1